MPNILKGLLPDGAFGLGGDFIWVGQGKVGIKKERTEERKKESSVLAIVPSHPKVAIRSTTELASLRDRDLN